MILYIRGRTLYKYLLFEARWTYGLTMRSENIPMEKGWKPVTRLELAIRSIPKHPRDQED